MRTALVVIVASLVVAGCSGSGGEPAPSPSVPTTPPPTTAPRPTTTPTVPATTPPPPTTASAPPTTPAPPATSVPTTAAPQELPSIAVGPDGIQYRGGGEEIEITGPSLLALSPDGGFHIHDPVGRRVWSFVAGEISTIDLPALDILAAEALAAASDHLVVAEFFFSPVRHRLHRVAFDGTLLETMDIPEGLRLEDGFSGLLLGSGGRIAIEREGGASYGVWDPEAGEWESVTTLSLDGTTVTWVEDGLEINGEMVTADLEGFGGLRYLGTAADGTVVIQRDDVLAVAPAWRVLTTVEWYTADGDFLGSARVPSLEEQYSDQMPGLVVAPDARVYALIALEDRVEVIELPMLSRRITELGSTA